MNYYVSCILIIHQLKISDAVRFILDISFFILRSICVTEILFFDDKNTYIIYLYMPFKIFENNNLIKCFLCFEAFKILYLFIHKLALL